MTTSILFLAAIGLIAAIYAHAHVGEFTVKPLPLHLILLLTGVCVGYVTMDRSGAMAAANFLAGFGAVHIPAAGILFLKNRQHAGKS